MPYIKDEIPIPGRKKVQAWLLGIGAISGLIAVGCAQNGNGKAMLIYGAIAASLIYAATKIKTKRKLKRGEIVYE